MGAEPGAHPELQAFARSRQQHPDVEGVEVAAVALGEPQHRRHAGRVVVRSGDDTGKGDVREERDADDQQYGGRELDDRDRERVDARQPQSGAHEERDDRPEERLEPPDRVPDELADDGPSLREPRAEGRPGARGVVVRDEHEHSGAVVVLAREHVL